MLKILPRFLKSKPKSAAKPKAIAEASSSGSLSPNVPSNDIRRYAKMQKRLKKQQQRGEVVYDFTNVPPTEAEIEFEKRHREKLLARMPKKYTFADVQAILALMAEVGKKKQEQKPKQSAPKSKSASKTGSKSATKSKSAPKSKTASKSASKGPSKSATKTK